MFKPGDKVDHTFFGKGKVLRISAHPKGQILDTEFGKEVGVKKLMFPPAPLSHRERRAQRQPAPAAPPQAEPTEPDAEEAIGSRLVLKRAWGTPNISLRRSEKRDIKASFREKVAAATVLEYEEIQAQFRDKNEVVKENAITWVRALGSEMQVLLDLLCAHEQGDVDINERELRYISTTLIWYVDNEDFIPDWEAGRGYLDDAHVLNLLIKHLGRRAPDLVDD